MISMVEAQQVRDAEDGLLGTRGADVEERVATRLIDGGENPATAVRTEDKCAVSGTQSVVGPTPINDAADPGAVVAGGWEQQPWQRSRWGRTQASRDRTAPATADLRHAVAVC